MQMRTINIIPNDYKGDPRQAGGYCWADYTNQVPGEDIIIGVDPNAVAGINSIYDMLEAAHGPIAIRDHGCYGWLKNTAEIRGGGQVNIKSAEPVAHINCMWCGGLSAAIYAVADCEPIKVMDQAPQQAGGTLEETASSEKMMENIELAELDARYKGHTGYCTKCHSFCYGDCDDNN
jgi:hypothetical protein